MEVLMEDFLFFQISDLRIKYFGGYNRHSHPGL